jgi:O-antigen ligase
MRIIEISCGVAIAASLLFGGATQKGSASDAIVQAACLPLLFFIAPEIWKLLRGRGWVAILLGLVVASPLLQLIPLPPSVWSALPGRTAVVETYQAVGLDLPWLGISISRWATVRVAFSLLPPVAIFLGVVACSGEERLRLSLLILFIGVASVILDIAQVVDGPESSLRFYARTRAWDGDGFFANRNHNAAFLYCLIPLGAFVFERSPPRKTRYAIAALLGFYLTISLGLLLTGSRSALGLGIVSFILTYSLILKDRFAGLVRGGKSIYIGVLSVFLVASILAPSFGLFEILDRFRSDEVASDVRWTIAATSFDVAKAFFPFGSGLGTFERVYPLFQSTSTIISSIVNHAHNDLFEIVLETGLLGVLVVAGWLALVVVYAVRNIRENDMAAQKEWFAAFIIISLLFVHSIWDYPMRTTALAAIFAYCCAVLSTVNGFATRTRESSKIHPQ